MSDACPKCGEPGGAKYTHACSPRAAVAKYARPPGWSELARQVERDIGLANRARGLAFRLLICDRCRAVWPTERDEAHGGARLDGDPCAYVAFGSKPCKGRVWPMNGAYQDAEGPRERPRAEGEWRVGDHAWREALGLPHGCKDIALVRRTYRKLAKELHPDVGGDTARMAKVNEAYAQALAELGQPS
jgi:hypothetical protein